MASSTFPVRLWLIHLTPHGKLLINRTSGHHIFAVLQWVKGSAKHYLQDVKPAGKQKMGVIWRCYLCLPNRRVYANGVEKGAKESISILKHLEYLQGLLLSVSLSLSMCVTVSVTYWKKYVTTHSPHTMELFYLLFFNSNKNTQCCQPMLM